MKKNNLLGIHHVSAIAGDVNEAIKFYTQVLELKLVKQTVNYDNKFMHHLYFGDKEGNVGTLFTIFIYDNDFMGRIGHGQVGTTAFEVPKGSFVAWERHLRSKKILITKSMLFNKPTLEFQDKSGVRLALVESEVEKDSKDILRIHGVELLSKDPEKKREHILSSYNVNDIGEDNFAYYLELVDKTILVISKKYLYQGIFGIGTVHHVAYKVKNDEILESIRDMLYELDLDVTDITNRNYFKSIYSKELGKIVFEFATIKPGLSKDEKELGSSFVLPSWFEKDREEILKKLPKIEV